MTRMLVLAALAGLAGLVMAACRTEEKLAIAPSSRPPPTAEISELEIRGRGVDRFVTCAPPGELGQQWIPPLPSWSPPEGTDGGAPIAVDQNFISRTADRTPTEMAVEATHRDFRSCYRKGLVRGGAQEGRVAIVLRIGADGRVASVEEHGACELDVQAIACMKASAARLRFQPPGAGDDTIVIPAAFTSREGNKRTMGSANDAYTASAYLTLEAARPGLHACEEEARRDLKPATATGTFVMAIAVDGHVTQTHVDPWTGEQSILGCAARTLDRLRFSPPPGGKGTVVARLNFNPRQATR